MSEQTTGHSQVVVGIFSRIAGVYDLLNHVLSLGIDILWRKYLAASVAKTLLHSTAPVLDLAAGTMDVTVELAKRYPGRRILALDFCPPMLINGLPKLAKLSGGPVLPIAGDARHLPLPNSSIAAITMAFGIRNVLPRSEAFQEAFRVLEENGILCIMEFGSAQDKILFGLYNWYLTKILPGIGAIISRDKKAYQYLASTITAFPSAKKLADEIRAAGFTNVQYTRYTAGIVCLHTGIKNKAS